MSKKKVRAMFTLESRGRRGYNVRCLHCPFKSMAWDYRQNALSVGFGHVQLVHAIESERGADAVRRLSASTLSVRSA